MSQLGQPYKKLPLVEGRCLCHGTAAIARLNDAGAATERFQLQGCLVQRP
jgi:hypothetical protein